MLHKPAPEGVARRQSMTLEVVHQHEKLALESGVKFMVLVCEACVKGLKHKQKQLLVLQPSVEFGQTHELTQFLKQDLNKDST